jgi:hypothetical protein
MQPSSATTATAPAAIATIPAVLFRSCTAGRIRTGVGGPSLASPGYWNVTGNVSVLLVMVFSPGTLPIVAVTV